MPFEEGKKKTGGRKKGAKNKKTTANKESLEALFMNSGGFEQLMDDISKLDERDKVTAKLKLIEFFMAKHKAVDHTTDGEPIVGISPIEWVK